MNEAAQLDELLEPGVTFWMDDSQVSHALLGPNGWQLQILPSDEAWRWKIIRTDDVDTESQETFPTVRDAKDDLYRELEHRFVDLTLDDDDGGLV